MDAQILAALSGGAIGTFSALVASHLSSRANRQQLKLQLQHERFLKNEQLMLNRLEELYLEIKKFTNATRLHYAYWIMMLSKNYSIGEIVKFQDNHRNAYDVYRLEMIINIYCPEATADYENILKLFGHIQSQEIDIIQKINLGHSFSNITPLKYKEQVEIYLEKINDFEVKISSIIPIKIKTIIKIEK